MEFVASDRIRGIKQGLLCIIRCSDVFLSHTWHISAFRRRELDTRRRAISVKRNRSDRRPSTTVGLSKIYSFPPTRDCRPLWRGPTTAGDRRRGRSQMKVTRYCVNNGSTCATNGAWRKTAKEGDRVGERKNSRQTFFSSDSGTLVKMSLHPWVSM